MTQATPSSLHTYKGHWFWKSAFRLMKDPIGFFEKNSQELGDTFYSQFPLGKIIITSNPELTKHVLQTNNKNYPKDKGYEQLGLLLGNGLVTSKNELWKKQRKIAQPTFHRKNMENLFQDMTQIVKNYLKELNSKRGQTIDISEDMTHVTAQIAMKALFSEDLIGDMVDFYHIITMANDYVSKRAMNPFMIYFSQLNGSHRKFVKQRDKLFNAINDLIEKRIASQESQSDFMQMLMDARYEDTGEAMPRDLLMDELVTIFAAGHETSANALSWLFYTLSQQPDVVEKLKTEINNTIGNDFPTYEDLKSMTYTKQVIEEGMRIFPPVWSVGRYAKEADEFNGIPIEKGMVVLMLIYHLHRHPTIWENPSTFDPENFAPEKVKERPNHYYMPFGAGPRMCIGNHFAMMEMQILLPLMIRDFNFELVKEHPIELDPMVTLRPKYGVMMKLS